MRSAPTLPRLVRSTCTTWSATSGKSQLRLSSEDSWSDEAEASTNSGLRSTQRIAIQWLLLPGTIPLEFAFVVRSSTDTQTTWINDEQHRMPDKDRARYRHHARDANRRVGTLVRRQPGLSGHRHSGHWHPGHWHPGHRHPGHRHPGHRHSGHRSSSIFSLGRLRSWAQLLELTNRWRECPRPADWHRPDNYQRIEPDEWRPTASWTRRFHRR